MEYYGGRNKNHRHKKYLDNEYGFVTGLKSHIHNRWPKNSFFVRLLLARQQRLFL